MTIKTSEYRDIFNHRGEAYHQAMRLCPDARRSEFTTPLGLLELEDGHVLCDFPSGGGYIHHFLPDSLKSIEVITLEASEEFAAQHHSCKLASWNEIPLDDCSVDAFISLAALHHTQERTDFYKEVFRVLKPGGKLVIGDVMHDTPQGYFLNNFVNEHNSMGHDGDFLVSGTETKRMQSTGFEITHDQWHEYPWEFPDQHTMIHFCQGLFGLDLADPDKVLDGLRSIQQTPNSNKINWALLFIRGHKARVDREGV